MTETKCLSLDLALNRALATDLKSCIDVLPFHASTIDDYAINSRDTGPDTLLHISQHIAAEQQSALP